MAADLSHHGLLDCISQETTEEGGGGSWYFSRREIEENSPSRQDGIDLKKETYLRKSYCTFLQDLGMRLKVPQVTIATAIIFCHRFFLRQSHAKNDRRNIATVCMFLAGKVEETPRPLRDVILVSYEIIHKKDPIAVQRIKQKEIYEKQKEVILMGERVVLVTLGFDLNILHPYKPLVEAIKKFRVAQNALAQVAWNFVNDGLRTSLCLQFKPHHIAAGAIFLAAKFLKVKLPHDGDKVWWQEFDVTPRQLEEVSNQMLELYEQNKAPAASEHTAGGTGPNISDRFSDAGEPPQMEVQVAAVGLGRSPKDVLIKKIDKDKVKAALERSRKSRGDAARKVDVLDDDDLIQRELEDGIEIDAERRQSWSKSSTNGQVEEGELNPYDRKRKAASPEGKHRHHEFPEERSKSARLGGGGFGERENKRHPQESHS